jgi:methanogenic corrinoid protein MtbC1
VVTDAVAAKRIGVREVYEQVLGPVQQELGRLWHMNDLTVAEEHFATATTAMVMSQLYPHLPRKPRHGKVVVAASVQGNQHDLGVRMVCDYFEMEGWRAVYLGANVPAPDLAIAVEHFACDLLCLSAYLPTQLRAVEDTIASVRAQEAGQRCKVLVGGPAFLEADVLWREIGADGYAQSAQDAVSVGARLVGV